MNFVEREENAGIWGLEQEASHSFSFLDTLDTRIGAIFGADLRGMILGR